MYTIAVTGNFRGQVRKLRIAERNNNCLRELAKAHDFVDALRKNLRFDAITTVFETIMNELHKAGWFAGMKSVLRGGEIIRFRLW